MENKIRVLNIIETIGSGGVEIRRLSLSKLLDKEKFQLKIICTHTTGPIADEIRSHGVEIHNMKSSLSSPFDWKQHREVMTIIDEFQPHIIHGAIFEGVTMAAVNGFFKRVPIVIIEETSDPQTRSWKANLLMKLFAKVSDKVIGVSPASVEYLKLKLKLPTSKIKLINNGVAIPRFVDEKETLELKKEIGLTNEIVIGTVGRMRSDSNKRFSDLIKAVYRLVKRGINVKLIMVGDGLERVNYEKLVNELKINENVFFAGYQNDTAKYYSIFDIFSLVSSHESFGLVLAEAMLSKLPVVATRIGGMKYIVDENTGFLVECFNVDEISKKLEILCKDENLRVSYGYNGYQKAKRLYTEDRYVKEVEDLYLSLIKLKGI